MQRRESGDACGGRSAQQDLVGYTGGLGGGATAFCGLGTHGFQADIVDCERVGFRFIEACEDEALILLASFFSIHYG